ncbi:MAG: sigma-70 family RNA polymerase sigma factor [Armatimonadetes bacterium]|nr:sigma-70 family RNA polymerase sigma factor [Armatimonadota bacterium]
MDQRDDCLQTRINAYLAGCAVARDDLGREVLAAARSALRKFGLASQDMDDLAQACAVDVIQHIGSYDRSRGAFCAWISGFAWNVVRGHQNRQIDYVSRPQENVSQTVTDQDPCLRNAIFTAMEALLPGERQLLELRFVMQLSSNEIAEFTGVTACQARKRISRAVDKLRRHTAVQDYIRHPVLG